MHDITLQFDTESDTPLYEQLYRFISMDIMCGRLKGGARLPSRRSLSRHLGISEQTVNTAYELLKAEGFLRSEERRGVFVEAIRPLGEVPSLKPSAVPPPLQEPLFDFSPQSTDINLFPFKIWARLIRDTLLDEPELMNRGDPRGEASLRSVLSSFLYQYRGVRSTAEGMVIASGVDLLLAAIGSLFDKSMRVGCEDPGYPEAYRIFSMAGHQCIPLAMDEQGVRTDLVQEQNLDLIYLTPAHQFPTGLSMPAGRRAELLYWASQRENRYLIEDDYDSEFRFSSRPLPALQGIDTHDRVIYLSTFSRSLAPGLRIAYMALPKTLQRRYNQESLRSGESVSRFEQQAMSRLLEDGHYSRHLRRAARVYQTRNRILCALLAAIPGAFLFGQDAGLHFLFGIHGRSEHDLIAPAYDAGIPLSGLTGYCNSVQVPPALVLGFGGLKDNQLEAAVQALRSVWQV